MKRIIPFFLIITVILTSCQHQKKSADSEPYMKAVWISCYDYTSADGKTEEEYKAVTDSMFRTISEKGLNTAFVHLRAFGDAFYESDIYPYSAYIAGTEGADLPFDPFAVLLESAENNGISVHGWINPFRISYRNDVSRLSEKNPAKKLVESGNGNAQICILENGIYLNPASPEAQKTVFDCIREILGKYKISGIHIDDYFYPSTDESIDKMQYTEYTASGGALNLTEWRRENVNAFVSAMYSLVKSYGDELTVSISPCAEIDKNKDKLFADVELWLSSEGYADVIIPQIYYGFEHEDRPFGSVLEEWGQLKRNKNVALVCGLAAYKTGTADEYAGKGKNEWVDNNNVIARQINKVENKLDYNGYVIFSYSDLVRI
ncbi:MAG: family 10 glycosylhydrolase [Clostridia bacterium]|nr:family 10 glycosylhydrolase [Clostridia bacterium]